MKIGIIGGGSIGLLYAYYLSEQQSVCLYVRSKEQMELLQSEGLFLERDGEKSQRFLDVKLYSEWRGDEDISLIAVKQYHLVELIELLYAYSRSNKAILFLQNGMGHLKWFDRIEGEVYIGTVEHGAMRTNFNHVIHTGDGLTKIALYQNSHSQFQKFAQSIDHERFPFIIEEDYEVMLLKKLIVNAVINPLTAILQVENGELIQNPYYYQLVKMIFIEIEQGLQLQNKAQYFENVILVCKKTAHNYSSMLCDLEEGRPTEVDAILGYILEKAAEREINTPIIETFYRAVKGKECKVEEQ
ncbi:2-dehydropantoate 2-reductase [Bacillus sp. V3B]|uniref:2-dehydropantoate 2-reductase n=1 Tax=Bacillus sp. V3B TaxID=2804915 RepID=UPI00210BE821|nr:2-dehydropantoate 2-reductase [Bacillus sp. V3B]